MTAIAFAFAANENEECLIFVATNAYDMSINNPNVKLVIHWDIPMSFNSMIQQKKWAVRKGGQSTLVFLPSSSQKSKILKGLPAARQKRLTIYQMLSVMPVLNF